VAERDLPNTAAAVAARLVATEKPVLATNPLTLGLLILATLMIAWLRENKGPRR